MTARHGTSRKTVGSFAFDTILEDGSSLLSVPRRRVWIAANTTWYVYNFRARLLERLVAAGHEVVAFSPRDEYVERLERLGVTHADLAIQNFSTNPAKELITLHRIYRALRAGRPDVLLTYTPKLNIYGAIAARLLSIRVIPNVSGLGRAFVSGGWLKFVSRHLYRIGLQHAQIVFFQNEEDRAHFIASGLVNANKAKRLPGSGVDLDRFRPTKTKSQNHQFVFLLAARLLWDKGVGEFVEAARLIRAKYPFVEFHLLGFIEPSNPRAVPRTQIEKWILEGAVSYLGTTDDMPTALAMADCVVLPSYYKEGVPRTLLEAASMALPVITTDMAGCRDAVDDCVTGYLVRPRDAQDLAEKMERLLRLPSEKRQAMGQSARDKMENEFDERLVIEHYIRAI